MSQKQISVSGEERLTSSPQASPASLFPTQANGGGTADERYLWPEACRVISQVRPSWFVGENVARILTMVEGGVRTPLGSEPSLFGEGGDLYEQRSTYTIERICKELESLGYSVQPVLIPAGAVGAPHRRDRVFIIAYTANTSNSGAQGKSSGAVISNRFKDAPYTYGRRSGKVQTEIHPGVTDGHLLDSNGCQRDVAYSHGTGRKESQLSRRQKNTQEDKGGLHDRVERPGGNGNAADAFCKRLEAAVQSRCYAAQEWYDEGRPAVLASDDAWVEGTWWDHFPTVSPVHTRDDGLSQIMDGTALGFTRWRTESIKAYGNAIVPQVMYRIFQTINQL